MHRQIMVPVFGGSKVGESALVPGINESSDSHSIIIVRNEALKGIKKCKLCGMLNEEYPIMYVDDNEDSLSNFCDKMDRDNIRVGVIPKDHILFDEVLKICDGGIWFSACREGLYETYIPLMEKNITKETHILVFDNDEKIVQKAKEQCQNPNINIHRCIIHSVCSSQKYDYDKQEVLLTSGKECILVLPPEVSEIKEIFNCSILNGRTEFIFTDTEAEFKFFELWKPICINAMHTLAAVKAYIKGVDTGMTLEEISVKKFSDIISKEEMLNYVLRIHSLLYDKYLKPYVDMLQVGIDIGEMQTKRFISDLYELQETIERGLNPKNSSFDSKLERHFPLLESSGDIETVKMLDKFRNLV